MGVMKAAYTKSPLTKGFARGAFGPRLGKMAQQSKKNGAPGQADLKVQKARGSPAGVDNQVFGRQEHFNFQEGERAFFALRGKSSHRKL